MRIEHLSAHQRDHVFDLVTRVVKNQGLRAEFYWTTEMLEDEWVQTEALGLYKSGCLAAVILYRTLPVAWEISLVATNPEFRRQGLMEMLLSHLINAQSRDRELWLEVHEANVSAQNLYEKLGFTKTGVRQRYYKDGGAALLYTCP